MYGKNAKEELKETCKEHLQNYNKEDTKKVKQFECVLLDLINDKILRDTMSIHGHFLINEKVIFDNESYQNGLQFFILNLDLLDCYIRNESTELTQDSSMRICLIQKFLFISFCLPFKELFKYLNTINQSSLLTDITKLKYLNDAIKWFTPQINLFDNINHIIYNSLFYLFNFLSIKFKESVTITYALVPILDMILLIKQYSILSSSTTSFILNKVDIDISHLHSISMKLYQYFEIIIFQSPIKKYKEQYKTYFKSNINKQMLFLQYYLDNKQTIYHNDINAQDCPHYHTIFATSEEEYCNFCFENIYEDLISALDQLLLLLNTTKTFDYEKIISPKSLQSLYGSLKKFIMLYMIDAYQTHNSPDTVNDHRPWLLNVINCYSLIKALNDIIEVCQLKTSNNRIKRILLYKKLSMGILKNNIILPLRVYCLKEIIIRNSLIIFNHFIYSYCDKVFLTDMVKLNDSDFNSQDLLICLKEISLKQNMILFAITNQIVKRLFPLEYVNTLRIYHTIVNPFGYYDIPSSNNNMHISLYTDKNHDECKFIDKFDISEIKTLFMDKKSYGMTGNDFYFYNDNSICSLLNESLILLNNSKGYYMIRYDPVKSNIHLMKKTYDIWKENSNVYIDYYYCQNNNQVFNIARSHNILNTFKYYTSSMKYFDYIAEISNILG